MLNNYFFNIDKKFEKIIKNSILMLKEIGVPISNSIYFANNGGYSYFGRTHKGNHKKRSLGYEYYITINKYLVKENDIYNTVFHELLHTIPKGMNHSGQWRKFADYLYVKTGRKLSAYGKGELSKEAYKRKKDFPIEEFDKQTMDIVYCPKCKKRLCLKKGLPRTKDGKSVYLCRKCRVNLIYL